MRLGDVRGGSRWIRGTTLLADAIIAAEVFAKKTQATPKAVIDACKLRLRPTTRLPARRSEQNGEVQEGSPGGCRLAKRRHG
jgi:hypothetical protein